MNVYQAQLGLARVGGLLPIGHRVYVEPDAEMLSKAWRQTGFSRSPSIVIDPKAKPEGELKELLPSDSVTLLFTGKPHKTWASWCKKHGIKVVHKSELSKVKMKGLLVAGSKMLGEFQLTEEAAELVTETFADGTTGGFFSICFTIENARDPAKTLLNLDDIARIWPDPGFMLARDIVHDLGTVKALESFQRVPRYSTDSIFGLWRYLDIVCGSKHPQWLFALHAFRSACDRKQYDYWEGLFLFIHFCYSQRQGKPSQLALRCNLPRGIC